MVNAFGAFARQLRLVRGINQTAFAKEVGLSVAQISNIENQRENVSDRLVGKYIRALNCSGEEANELRKRASFANTVRKSPAVDQSTRPLQAMLAEFGDKVSESAREEIREILERETGETLAELRFSSNAFMERKRGRRRSRSKKRPWPSTNRFVEICLAAERARREVAGETEKLEIGIALEKLSHLRSNLNYQIVDSLPPSFDGAFACIVGNAEGHTVILEQDRFVSATKGVYFARHVIAHEVAHHFLHADLLDSASLAVFDPQALARNTAEVWTTEHRIEQVVDTIEEAEAEIFATLFLVPWSAFFKGTEVSYLADDFGEQLSEVRRYATLFRTSALRDALRHRLWAEGRRQHLIFKVED